MIKGEQVPDAVETAFWKSYKGDGITFKEAIAAALNAWRGAQQVQCHGSVIDENGDVAETTALILPLGEQP